MFSVCFLCVPVLCSSAVFLFSRSFCKVTQINKVSVLLQMDTDGSKPTRCFPQLAVAHSFKYQNLSFCLSLFYCCPSVCLSLPEWTGCSVVLKLSKQWDTHRGHNSSFKTQLCPNILFHGAFPALKLQLFVFLIRLSDGTGTKSPALNIMACVNDMPHGKSEA